MNEQIALRQVFKTIQQFQQTIDKQLRPLGLDYLHLLTLLSIKQQRLINIREQSHLQALIAGDYLTEQLLLTDKGEHTIDLALLRLQQFEQRLFANQQQHNSLLSQLEVLFQINKSNP